MSTPIYNPPVPYAGPIHGGFRPGCMVRIQGRVNPSAHSLALNLCTGPGSYDDIALHINPRFTEQILVRNSRISGSWGHEERQGTLPIYRDQNFEILILCEPQSFKIAVNAQHFAEFNHRVQPLERVNHLGIEGDLTLQLIQIEGASPSQVAYQPTAPPIMGGGPGALPYPTSGGALPSPGFNLPPAGGHQSYPPPQVPQGYPAGPVGQQPYASPYPAPQGGGGYYPQQQQPPVGGYYNPGGAAQHGYPAGSGSSSGGGGGLLGNAGKLLAGGLAGVGLANVANKIPGMGGKSGHGHGGGGYPGGGYPAQGGYPGGGYPQQGGHSGGGGMGPLGGILGGAAALGVGGLVANKAMKKGKKKNKMLKYGLPVGGAVLGGYALKKGMKGHGFGHGSSSSSSSSSEEE